jgi:hypothetical protein
LEIRRYCLRPRADGDPANLRSLHRLLRIEIGWHSEHATRESANECPPIHH